MNPTPTPRHAALRHLAMLLLGFAYMVLLIEALRVAVAWWRGEIPAPAPLDWLLLAALPVLAWIWWRFLSPFGCGRGRCLLPDDAGRPGPSGPPPRE